MNETSSNKRFYLIIILVGLVIYFQSLFFGFTYFDDNVLILDNLFFLRNLGNLGKVFTLEVFHILHSSAAYYRPLLTLSYMLDAVVVGDNPWLYHLTSVGVHLAVACLVFNFLTKINWKKITALAASLVFVVHPVLIQAVSWIPGRNDSLLALFVLVSFLALAEYLNRPSIKWLIVHWLVYAGCLFTKESAIFLPLLLVSFGYIFLDRKTFTKNLPVVVVGWLFWDLIWFYLRSLALSTNPINYNIITSLKVIVANFPAILLYLGKVVFPVNLSVLPTLPDSTLVYGWISLVLIILGLVFSKDKRYLVIVFGLTWWLIFLLPSFIRPNTVYVADFLEHRVYVPIIGLIVMMGELTFVKRLDLKKYSHLYSLIIVVVILGLINLVHNRTFAGKIPFWLNAVAHSPHHPLAHKNLGAMYYLDNQLDKAEVEFKRSVELNPSEAMIHNNLGLIYFRKKDYAAAEREFFRELELYPSYDNAHANLGLLYYVQGFKDKARDMWLKTVAINPDHKEALRSLAVYYQAVGDIPKAQYYSREAAKRGVGF